MDAQKARRALLMGAYFAAALFPGDTWANPYELVGKIVDSSTRDIQKGGRSFVQYRLRVKQREPRENALPFFFHRQGHS